MNMSQSKEKTQRVTQIKRSAPQFDGSSSLWLGHEAAYLLTHRRYFLVTRSSHKPAGSNIPSVSSGLFSTMFRRTSGAWRDLSWTRETTKGTRTRGRVGEWPPAPSEMLSDPGLRQSDDGEDSGTWTEKRHFSGENILCLATLQCAKDYPNPV